MYKLILVLIISLSIQSLAQEKELIGEWILVRSLKLDNSRLEINSSYYSNYDRIEIKPNQYLVLWQNFEAKYEQNKISMPFRTIHYRLQDGYLITEEEGFEMRNYYLKIDDFVEKFPEFQLTSIDRDGRIVYVDNRMNAYKFNKVGYLQKFINDNLTLNGRDSKTFEKLYFQVEFVLTTQNKIKDIQVIHSIDKSYDNDFISALRKAEPFLVNLTDKDVLITLDQEQLKWTKDLKDKQEKKLHDLHYKGTKAYHKNNFEDAIKFLTQINDLTIRENRFNSLFEEANIFLGVSYLITGNQTKACESFRKVGDITKFSVRNYLLDFCQN